MHGPEAVISAPHHHPLDMKTHPIRHIQALAVLPILILSTTHSSAGRGLDEEAYVPTLEAGGMPSILGANLLNMSLHGAHHIPLQMQQADRQAWLTSDFGHNDYYDSDSCLIEVGTSTGFLNDQLVAGFGVGQSWVDQELRYDGDVDMDGQYLLGELSYRATGSPIIYTLTASYGGWDADIQRNYDDFGTIESSYGDTDVNAAAIRLRVDWLDAANVLGFSIAPKIEYTFTSTDSDSYTETGGAAPSSFQGESETSHQARYGITASRDVLGDKGLLRVRIEGVHRFDNDDAAIATTSVYPGNYNLDSKGVRQDWAVLGLDLDYELCPAATLTSGVFGSTSSEDATLGATLGLRVDF